MRVASREVCIAGITTSQMVRNISFADFSFLSGCRYLLHDRDAKLCAALTGILETVGIQAVKLPARRPNLNAHLERWHRSVKKECLWKMIFFGEASLRRLLSNYVLHFHHERNHQGKENVTLFPKPADRIGESIGSNNNSLAILAGECFKMITRRISTEPLRASTLAKCMARECKVQCLHILFTAHVCEPDRLN
jgi:Integrase core domain